VLDSVGETLERAHWDALLGRILTGGVGLGEVRDDNLNVGLGSESSRFEKRLSVKDTSSIHVLTYGERDKGERRSVSSGETRRRVKEGGEREDERATTLSRALVTPSSSAKKASP
jgi:hypothetical protein